MGLLATEGFLDAVYIVDANGNAKSGLSPTCKSYRLDTGAETSHTVSEITGKAIYKVTDMTPAADTEYMTVWAVTGDYTIHYPYKLFKVGGGQEAEILSRIGDPGASNLDALLDTIDTVVDAIKAKTDNLPTDPADDSDIDGQLATIDGLHDVPTADVTDNAQMRDVAGNKTDAAVTSVGTTKSVMAYIKGAISLLVNGTYGLSAIETLIDDLESRLTALRAGYLDELDFDLDARLGSPAGASIAADLLTIDNLVDDLESRLTALRAGYLDELDFGLAEYLEDLRQKATSPAWNQDTDSLEAIREAVDVVDTVADGIKSQTDKLVGSVQASNKSHPSGTTEEELVIITLTVRTKIHSLDIFVQNLTKTTTFRIYKHDGTDYRFSDELSWIPDDPHPQLNHPFAHDHNVKVTIQSSEAEGSAKTVYWSIIKEAMA